MHYYLRIIWNVIRYFESRTLILFVINYLKNSSGTKVSQTDYYIDIFLFFYCVYLMSLCLPRTMWEHLVLQIFLSYYYIYYQASFIDLNNLIVWRQGRFSLRVIETSVGILRCLLSWVSPGHVSLVLSSLGIWSRFSYIFSAIVEVRLAVRQASVPFFGDLILYWMF